MFNGVANFYLLNILITSQPIYVLSHVNFIGGHIWLKYCRYGVKYYPIYQSTCFYHRSLEFYNKFFNIHVYSK